MYKVDLKTLEEITATLDALTNTNTLTLDFVKIRIKARKLSQKIKDNYTEIKIS
jgi:hypothetical protein